MKPRILFACLLALSLAPLQAHAAGESSADSKTSTTSYLSEADLTAKYGDLGGSFTAAVTLAKLEQYDESIAMLKALGKDGDPRVLNYLGFAHRKSGKVDEAIVFYEKALKLEPHYAAVREYLGEAYLKKDKVDDAKAQLDKIKAICGTGCSEYMDLTAAIEAH